MEKNAYQDRKTVSTRSQRPDLNTSIYLKRHVEKQYKVAFRYSTKVIVKIVK